MTTRARTIVFAGGGTGGHLFPGIAVARRLQAQGNGVHPCFLHTGKALDRELLKPHGFEHDSCGTLRLRGWRTALEASTRWAPAIMRCRRWLKARGVSHVVGCGGYGSALALVAAHGLRLPFSLLEQNVLPGRVTRWMAPRARAVFTSWEASRRYLPRRARIVTCGNPIFWHRRRLGKEEARRKLGLDPKRPTILVSGGSQGARALNEWIFGAAAALREYADRIQVIHLCGAADEEAGRRFYRSLGAPHALFGYCQDMGPAYSAADILVGRAGATTIAEALCFGIPLVLVPYPFAAQDHQTLNAEQVAAAGAGICVPQRELNEEVLRRILRDEVLEAATLARRSVEAARLSRPEAAEGVARWLCNSDEVR